MHPTRALRPPLASVGSPLSRLPAARVATLTARATPSSPPDAPPASESLTLADYTPHPIRYAPLAAWPVGIGAAGALAGLSHTISLIAGGLCGGTLGLLAGASLGLLIDHATGNNEQPVTQRLALVGFVAGLVGGGAVGAMLVGPAVQVALGVGGVLLGTSIAVNGAQSVQEKVSEAADDRAQTGTVRLAELFAQIEARERSGHPRVAEDVRTMARLEDAGWRFGATQATLTAHVRQSYEALVLALPPGGNPREISLSLLPVVAFLSGLDDDPAVDDRALLDTVKRFSDQGRQLQIDGSGSAPPKSPADAAIQTAQAYDALSRGKTAVLVHDGAHMRVKGHDAASLEAAMKSTEQTIATYDQVLAPAFASRKLGVRQKEQIYDAIAENVTARLTFERAASDVTTLLNRALRPDAIPAILRTLSAALDTVDSGTATRYHDLFMLALSQTDENPKSAARAAQVLSRLDPRESESGLRMLSQMSLRPEDRTPEEIAAMEALVRAASRQSDYSDIGVDFATLAALRDPSMSLTDAAREYEILLSGLAAIDAAEEAAPTYAFIRSGLAQGTFGVRTYDQILESFFTACASGADPQDARRAVLESTPTSDSSVRREDGVVIIGGISVPVKR